MASQYSPESEDYYSLSGNELEDEGDDAESEATEPPVHPISAMQAAFEESIIESTQSEETPRRSHERDAGVRRQKLLNSQQYDQSLNSRWNQRATAQHHPLVKLLAQIIFGMHLLQQEQAKSEEEVVKILQTHVNEVDSFLERTSEDFELAIKDIEERIRFLKLPMKHLEVFNTMLDEKKFRTQLLDGNEKIEKIIERTAAAMNAALLDVETGLRANRELSWYLDSVHDKWPREKRAISDVFGAMRGNEQGWMGYLKDLEVKGETLGSNLERLGQVIAHMSKLAAAASRRNKGQGDRAHGSPSGSKSVPDSPGLRSKFAPDPALSPMSRSPPSRSASLNKPLPREPPVVVGATQVGISNGVHPVPLAERFEKPRQTPRSPDTQPYQKFANEDAPRPKTVDGPVRRKEARAADARVNTDELLQFFRQEHLNPLRSNPPVVQQAPVGWTPEKKPVRSQSQGANRMLETRVPETKYAGPKRSLSQSATEAPRKPKVVPIHTGLPAIRENEKPAAHQPSNAQDSSRRSAFARRLSRRMRHMQEPEETRQRPQARPPSAQIQTQPAQLPPPKSTIPSPSSEKTTSPPIDSAYASSVEKPAPPSHEPPVHSAPSEEQEHPIKGFTLFPTASLPMSPATSAPPTQDDWAAEGYKSVARPMSKGRTFGSVRRYFHRRKASGMRG